MRKFFKSIVAAAAIAAVSFTASAHTTYRGFVDIDGTFSVSYSKVSPSSCSLLEKPADMNANFTTTHGVQINRSFFVGGGAGFVLGSSSVKDSYEGEYRHDESSSELNLYLPVFVAARWDLNIASKVTPFVSCKLGYIVGLTNYGVENVVDSDGVGCGYSLAESGFFYQPTVGVRFRLHHHIGLNVGLTLYPTYYKTDNEDGGYRPETNVFKKVPSATYSRLNFGLNVGIDF